jgi:putative phage-type endonuclease
MNPQQLEQGSKEWKKFRMGFVGSSRVATVLSKKDGATRKKLLMDVVTERVTGKAIESFTSMAMQWGIDTEPKARDEYAQRNFLKVEKTGFVLHPYIEYAGASPDGLVGNDGLLEIKCPNTSTHIETLIDQKAPTKYIPQMQFQMACTGRQWCDFVSFDPRIEQSFFQIRVERDNEYIEKMEKEVSEFLEEVDRLVNQIQGNINE